MSSFCYPPGTYWIRVYAVGASVPCGQQYVLRVTAVNQDCLPCSFEVPPASPPGCVSENETCGADTNGGCDSTAELFGTIACNQCVYGRTWASSGKHDTDYYKLILPSAQYVQWTVDAEFPAVIWLLQSPLNCAALAGDAEAAGACYQVTHKILDADNQQLLLPAGTYYLMVQPGAIVDSTVISITENYPCGSGRNDYWIYVQCSSDSFP